MSNRIDTTESRRRGHGRFGRRGAALLLALVGIVGLVPTGSSATPTFKIRVVDLSAPQATSGESYTLRTDVVTTCTPVMEGGSGSCGMVDVTVSWWTDTTAIKVAELNVLMVGGPLSFQIPAADVKAPRIHYRVTAGQVWTLSNCLYNDPCPKEQTAGVTVHGSAQVI